MSQQVLDALKAKHGDAIEHTGSIHGDEFAFVKRDRLIAVATWLRDDPAMAFDAPVFATCTDLLEWDHPAGPSGVAIERDADGAPVHRFEVSYQLRSQKHRHRIRIKVRLAEAAAKLPSLAPLWAGFDWQERETFDLYGIVFEGHPDLRRIYLYDEFVGFPLRKDYPKEQRQPLVRRDDLLRVGPRRGDM
jgi:NADH-quinone oxidoreductase subunit C